MTIDAGADVHVNAPDATSGIDAVLAPAGHVTGTVTDASTTGLGGIKVHVYASLDDYYGENGPAGWTLTNPDGTYDLGGLPAGDGYLVEFRDDDNGDYITQYYDGQVTIEAATPVSVTPGTPLSGIDAVLAPAGHITGTVTDASTTGLGGISVNAYRNNGPGNWEWANGTRTNPDGTYDLGGLPTGDYRIEFYDDSGDYVTQWFDNSPIRIRLMMSR